MTAERKNDMEYKSINVSKENIKEVTLLTEEEIGSMDFYDRWAGDCCCYWSRTPGEICEGWVKFYNDGEFLNCDPEDPDYKFFLEEEDPSEDCMYARPALKVDAATDKLKALKKGERVEAFKENWIVVSNTEGVLTITLESIENCNTFDSCDLESPFNEDGASNVFEGSDVQTFLQNWFDTLSSIN